MDPYARSLVKRPSRAELDERRKEPANRRSHRGSALSGLVLVSLNFFLPRSVGPERGTTGGRAGGGVPLQCLHSAQAGKWSRIRQTLHSNLKVSGFQTALEQEHDRTVSKSIPSCPDNVCRMIFIYLITQGSIIHIIWNSGRTASTLPLPRSDTSCM